LLVFCSHVVLILLSFPSPLGREAECSIDSSVFGTEPLVDEPIKAVDDNKGSGGDVLLSLRGVEANMSGSWGAPDAEVASGGCC
jgi:hypothetical protein